jgi:transposase-like protein
VAYSLSLRNLEEMMAERGVEVDHSSVHRWVIKLVPLFDKAFRRNKRAVGKSWRMDETYIKVRGHWKYLYRAVDKEGAAVDFLLRAHRDKAAARRYFEKAIAHNGEPETITVDKSGANLAALEALNTERGTPIKVRQNRYLNNIVEQDHRAVKRIVKPMTGFNSFRCARIILSGIELMHMIRRTDAGRARYQNCGQAVLFADHVSIPIHNRLHASHFSYRDTSTIAALLGGMAQAQSSVTLYGIAEASLRKSGVETT